MSSTASLDVFSATLTLTSPAPTRENLKAIGCLKGALPSTENNLDSRNWVTPRTLSSLRSPLPSSSCTRTAISTSRRSGRVTFSGSVSGNAGLAEFLIVAVRSMGTSSTSAVTSA